jgi:hypothetical protein
MELYAILRRSGWRSGADLEEAAGRSTKVGNEEMPDEVRWIRSYVLDEGGGSVGTVCIYEATSPTRSAGTPRSPIRRSTRLFASPIRSSCGPILSQRRRRIVAPPREVEMASAAGAGASRNFRVP